MEFIDRRAVKPNRFKVTPENGAAAYYVTMERADEVVVEGTPLNAATLNTIATSAGVSPADVEPEAAVIQVRAVSNEYDGMTVVFKAPCGCSEVTGIRVGGTDFTFRDTHGNDLTGIGNLFDRGALVKATLDTANQFAYIQNADTNGYLERQLKSMKQYLDEKLADLTDADGVKY